MRTLRIAGAGLILAVLAIAVLGNWTLGAFLLGGLLLGWHLRIRWLLIGLVVLVWTAVAAVLVWPNYAPPPPCAARSFAVREQSDARYDDTRDGWLVSRQFTVLAESMEAMTSSEVPSCGSGADLGFTSTTPTSQRISTIATLLAREGWRLTRVQNNEPVFSRPAEFLPAAVRTFPQLTTRLSIPTSIPLAGFSLWPGRESTISLTAPRGMILATTPPSEPKRVTDGELSRVDLTYAAGSVEIQAVSPLARFEPIRSLLDLTKGDVPGYLLGFLAVLLVAVFKDQLKERMVRLLRREGRVDDRKDIVGPDDAAARNRAEGVQTRSRPHRLRKPTRRE